MNFQTIHKSYKHKLNQMKILNYTYVYEVIHILYINCIRNL
jgi:hypothetical protein